MLSFLKHVFNFFSPSDPRSTLSVEEAIILATKRSRKLLNEDGSSFTKICISIEEAKSKKDLKVAFSRLNDLMWTLSMIAPLTEQNGIICEVLKELKFSKKFGFYLNTAPTPQEAICAYKTAVVQELAEHYRKLETFRSEHDRFEDALFNEYFPSTFWQSSKVKGTVQEKLTDLCSSIVSPCRKRKFSKCTDSRIIQCMEMGPESKSANKRTRFENSTYKRRAS